jgi:hypothetical protein
MLLVLPHQPPWARSFELVAEVNAEYGEKPRGADVTIR